MYFLSLGVKEPRTSNLAGRVHLFKVLFTVTELKDTRNILQFLGPAP